MMEHHDGELTADERAFFRADDEDGWDQENALIGVMTFANAVQVWSIYQSGVGGTTQERRGATSVRQAATAFNVPPAMIIGAVKAHHWMFLTGPRDDYDKLIIEHEGE